MHFIFKYLLLGFTLAATPVSASDHQTFQAALISMPLEYQLDGVVEASRKATLSAEVTGKIEAVFFDVGDFVEKSEILVKIRDQEYRARKKIAVATLDEAMANLRDNEQDFERNRDLRKQKLISQAVFDKAEANLKSSQARVNSARANLSNAEEQLGYTVLRAPYSGVVVERHVEPGESTAPGQAIMTGYALGELRVSANLPQSQVAGLRKYRNARVIALEDGRNVKVSKITIHPVANPNNHSFPLRLDIARTDTGLYPGMLVKVAIKIGSAERLLIPRKALVSRSEVNAVYLLDNEGRYSFRQVRPGNRFGDKIEILAGLSAGEVLSVDPVRAGIEHKRQLEQAQ